MSFERRENKFYAGVKILKEELSEKKIRKIKNGKNFSNLTELASIYFKNKLDFSPEKFKKLMNKYSNIEELVFKLAKLIEIKEDQKRYFLEIN